MTTTAILTKLCDASEISEDMPLRAEVDDVGYAIFVADDVYYVTADLCSHGPGSLSDGFVENLEVECPFHQGRFCIKTGKPTAAPCETPIRTWTPVVRDGAVYIDIDTPNAA